MIEAGGRLVKSKPKTAINQIWLQLVVDTLISAFQNNFESYPIGSLFSDGGVGWTLSEAHVIATIDPEIVLDRLAQLRAINYAVHLLWVSQDSVVTVRYNGPFINIL